jgi:pyroglutamyl-peptidase
MTILVAGFSSFPDAPVNPTEQLVQSLEGCSTAGGEAILSCLLPVDWGRSWPLLRQAIEAHRPHSVLVFGLHSGAGRLRFELTGHNGRELGRADAVGGFPSGPQVTEGPEILAARLPLTRMAASLREAGVDFELSRDAGRYLCNDTLYRLCRHAAALGVERYGFIHTPLTDGVVETYLAANVMPIFCHTISDESLRCAALALCETLSPAESAAAPAV